MELVLNERTETVHKHETGGPRLHTECGITYHLDPDRLRLVSFEQPGTDHSASKCGRCFDDGGSY